MIFVLKGADASAKNIGQIILPENMDEDARRMIEYLGRFSLASNEGVALNRFVLSLKTSGVWSKVGKMYIPYWSNSAAKAFYEAKSGVLSTVDAGAYGYDEAQDGVYILPNIALERRRVTVDNGIDIVPTFYVSIDKPTGGTTCAYISDSILPDAYQGNAILLNNSVPVKSGGLKSVNWSKGMYAWHSDVYKAYIADLKSTDGVNPNGSVLYGIKEDGTIGNASYTTAIVQQASSISTVKCFVIGGPNETLDAAKPIPKVIIIGNSTLTTDERGGLVDAVQTLYNDIFKT